MTNFDPPEGTAMFNIAEYQKARIGNVSAFDTEMNRCESIVPRPLSLISPENARIERELQDEAPRAVEALADVLAQTARDCRTAPSPRRGT